MSGRIGGNRAWADLGLVTLVVGGALSLMLSIMALGLGALLGRIPLLAVVLPGVCMLVSVTGLIITVVTARNPEGRTASASDEDS